MMTLREGGSGGHRQIKINAEVGVLCRGVTPYKRQSKKVGGL